MNVITKNLVLNVRLWSVLLLGFASGLPLALTGSTLQAWFTESNVAVVTIGTLSLLGIPYTLKFLWAPIMDAYGLTRLGKYKSWVLITQFLLIIFILLLANMDPTQQAIKIGSIALLIAFFSASQDIAINAYQTEILDPAERGLGAAYYIFTYRIAALISGGFALIFADYVGWKLTYEWMAFLMAGCLIITFFTPKPVESDKLSHNIWQTVRATAQDLLMRDRIFIVLLFIFLYKFGDALALSLMTNFLLHGLHFTLSQVGLVYKSVSFIAVVLGAFLGGILLTRLNIYRALLYFGLAQAFSTLLFVVLAIVGKQFIFMSVSLFVENFCSGLSTAALVAFMMSLCHREFTATQFALLSAIASLGRVFLGPVAGVLVENIGWAQFYFTAFLLSFPGIVVLCLLKNKGLQHAIVTVD